MTLGIHDPEVRARSDSEPLSAPSVPAGSDPSAEALFREARRKRHRRWFVALTALIASSVIAAGLVVSSSTVPPQHRGGRARSADGGSSATLGHVIVRGNGIGTAYFGQPEAEALPNLERILGSLRDTAPMPSNNCTIDSYLRWPTVTAYFDHQSFVGYSTGSLEGGPGYRDIPNATTAAGLGIGNSLVQARRLYGGDLTTSLVQGGSWLVTTPQGTFAGLLTNEVNERKGPPPRIADITAGSVGCPAASP